jgi:hypothetical protein
MNIKTIEALKKSAINFQKWIDDGLTIDDEMDETDVYLSDLFNAIATPKNILELIVELEHTKANNANLTERNRILRLRHDLPVDRLPYIKRLDEYENNYISIQEAWNACGGNKGINPNKQQLIDALKELDLVCDELDKLEDKNKSLKARISGGVI